MFKCPAPLGGSSLWRSILLKDYTFHVFISFLFSKKASVTGVLFCLPKFNSNLKNDILSTIFGTQLHFSGAKSLIRLHFSEHYQFADVSKML
jgi:hypothetical protein